MTTKDALVLVLDMSRHVTEMFLGDLTDEDLLVRPCPGANHVAWQIGHLITSEARFIGELPGAAKVNLPAGFVESHAKEAAARDTGFADKATYLAEFRRVRDETVRTLKQLPDEFLDKPNVGPMAKFAPTYGALFVLVGHHTMMHAGQFSVVRRKVGRPVLF